MPTIRELLIQWGVEVNDEQLKALNNAIGATKGRALAAGDALIGFGKRASAIGRGMVTGITLPVVGIGAAMVKAAADAEESESKFEAVFKNVSGEVRAWSDTFATAANRNAVELRNQAAEFGAIVAAMGFSRQAAGQLSTRLTELTVDLASFNNMAEPDVLIALRSGLLGNVEPVLKFGADVRVAAVEQELLNMGLRGGVRAATEQQKVLARMNILLRATKDAQGDAMRTSGSLTNRLRGMGAATKEAAIRFASDFLPALKPVVEALTNAARAFGRMTAGEKQLVVQAALALAALGPLILIIGKLVTVVGGAIKAFTFLRAALAATAAAAAGGAVTFAALLGPIGLLVAAAAMIISEWDAFRDFFRMIGVGIGQVWEAVVNRIEITTRDTIDGARAAWSDLVGWFELNVVAPLARAWDGLMQRFADIGAFPRELIDFISGQAGSPQFAGEGAFGPAAGLGAGVRPATTAPPRPAAGGASVVNMESRIELTFPGGTAPGERQRVADDVRRVVREEQDRSWRRAARAGS